MYSFKQRHAVWQKKTLKGFLLPFFILGVLFGSIITLGGGEKAQAVTSSTLNFQGRLLTNTGARVPDGSYNIEFKLYTAANIDGGESLVQGSCQTTPGPIADEDCAWVETRTGGNTVTVQNGYFSVNLGSVNPFPSTINWDQELWLGMNIGGIGTPSWDGEMTPRFKLTAVPYAFRAGALMNDAGTSAFTADDLTQITPSSVQTANAAVAALRINQTGAGGLLQLQGNGADVFTVSKSGGTTISGAVLAQNTLNSTQAFEVNDASGNSFIQIDTQNGDATFGSVGTTTSTLQAGSGGVRLLSGGNVNIGQVDSSATLVVLDSSSGGDPAGTNGAMYYNSVDNKFRCYENGAWKDCIGGNSSGSAQASFISGLQNVPANGTSLTVETLVFTSATAVSNTAGVTGFTAPADGSFRTCLIKNNAAITAGTLSLRWMVNGVPKGSAACTMNATNNRQATTALDSGSVTFAAGDTIGISFDTSNTFLPAGTNDFTVYWGVEYTGSAVSGSGSIGDLQSAYDNSVAGTITASNNKDLTITLPDTAIDSNFVIDILSGSTSKFILQNNGTDSFSVDSTGNIVTTGGITLGTSTSTTAGTIRWTGLDFEGFDGSSWLSLTGGGGGSSISSNYVNVVKTVNETVNNSIALQDDDQLVFSIGPNETWTFRYVVQANSGTVPDLQFAVSAPAGATCNVGYSDPEGATAIGQIGCGVTTGILPGNGATDLYEIVGTVINGSNAGNVTLRWAQNTANASNTIVYAGSYVTAYRSMGSGGAGQPFAQSGNSFGTTGVLGTTDANGLSIITDNIQRIGVSSTGDVSIAGLTTLSGNLVANRTATGTTGTTSGTGSATTTLNLTADVFGVNDVIYIDNAGQDYYTRVTADSGTGSYTVSPAVTYENARTVTKYTVQNIGATATDYTSQANRFFQGYFLGGIVVGAGSTTISDGLIERTTGDITLTPGTGGVVQVNGTINATTIIGDGAGLTNISGTAVDGSTITALNASNISSGTVADARLSSNVTLLGNTFNGASQLVQLDGSGALPAISGASLTSLTAANLTGALPAISGASLTSLNGSSISTGTVADARLSSNVTLLGNTFNGVNQLVQLGASGELPALSGANLTSLTAANLTGALPAISGANLTSLTAANLSGALPAISGASLTSLNGSNISSGTVADARLSSNVTLLGNIFNGINQLVQLNGSGALPAISGANLTSLTSANLTGALPAISGASLTSLTAANLTGALPAISGASLTSLNGSNISSGTVADARLSTNVTLAGNTFNGINQLVQLNGSGALPALSGANLTSLTAANLTGALPAISGASVTSLNGSNISSGTVADARLSSNVTLLGNTFNGVNQLVQLNASGQLPAISGINLTNIPSANLSGALPAISGASLTSLNGSNISSGTVADARLSSNVTLMTNTFNGINQLVQLNGSGALPALNAANLTSLTSGNLTGALPAISGASLTSLTAGNLTGALPAISGANLTSLNGTNISSGTVADGRLSTNVALLTGTQSFTGTKSFASGGFVLGQSTLSSSASVARAVSLPDEAGTICLSNKDTCGYLRLASGAAQTDSSNNDVLSVNKTSATGNLITMQRSGAAVFTVANSGALQIQSTSSTALDIRNSGGTSYFSVDTSTGEVNIGPSVADATGVLFVLDTKNTSGDPTGTEGAQYYNSATGTFRCYQGVRGWTDCLGVAKPNNRRTTRIDYQGSGTAFAGQGDISTQTASALTAVTATTAEPAMINHATSGANGNVASVSGNTNYSTSNTPMYQTYVQLVSTTTQRVWIGITNQTSATMGASANPAGNYAAFRYDTSVAGETTWKCITKDNATQTINDSGVTVSAAAGYKFEIVETASAVVFKINNTIVCTNTTNLPTAGTMVRYSNSITNLNATTHSMRIAWIFLDTDF